MPAALLRCTHEGERRVPRPYPFSLRNVDPLLLTAFCRFDHHHHHHHELFVCLLVCLGRFRFARCCVRCSPEPASNASHTIPSLPTHCFPHDRDTQSHSLGNVTVCRAILVGGERFGRSAPGGQANSIVRHRFASRRRHSAAVCRPARAARSSSFIKQRPLPKARTMPYLLRRLVANDLSQGEACALHACTARRETAQGAAEQQNAQAAAGPLFLPLASLHPPVPVPKCSKQTPASIAAGLDAAEGWRASQGAGKRESASH